MKYWNKENNTFESIKRDNLIEISDEDYESMLEHASKNNMDIVADENGKPIFIAKPSLTEEELLDQLRNKRKILLIAFDKWEKAVLRGRETDSTLIMQWYQNLLNLNQAAFDNIPERIQYYLT